MSEAKRTMREHLTGGISSLPGNLGFEGVNQIWRDAKLVSIWGNPAQLLDSIRNMDNDEE